MRCSTYTRELLYEIAKALISGPIGAMLSLMVLPLVTGFTCLMLSGGTSRQLTGMWKGLSEEKGKALQMWRRFAEKFIKLVTKTVTI